MVKLRWNHLYYLLAVFDIAAVSGSLYLNHRIMAIYESSVEVNSQWSGQLRSLGTLGDLAVAVNAPGNNVFDDQNVEFHTGRRDAAMILFDAELSRLSSELADIASQRQLVMLQPHIKSVQKSMTAMTIEADFIFDLFSKGEGGQAGSRMATMDRKAAALLSEISAFARSIDSIQAENFVEQFAAASAMKRYEIVIACVIVLMVAMVTVYGHKLAVQMRNADAQKRSSDERLEEQAVALAGSEERVRSVLESVPDCIVTMNHEGIIETANPSAELQFKYSSSELIGKSIAVILPDQDVFALYDSEVLVETLTLSNHFAQREFLGQRKCGEQFNVEVCLSDFEISDETKFTAVIRDVTDKKKAANKISRLALFDALTGLSNRHNFSQSFSRFLSRDSSNNRSTALFLLDLDRFKSVNDTYGHPMGDALLVEVSDRLRKCFREDDHIARLGGDEFAVIVGNLEDPSRIDELAARVVESIGRPFHIDGVRIDTATSIGIALHPKDDVSPEELVRKSDLALYSAKADGRSMYKYFEPHMHDQLIRSKTIELELREAMSSDQLFLVYQPIVEASKDRIFGAEALIRWRHPDGSIISPDSFIPIAEQSRLILEIGYWVIEEACNQWLRWQDMGVAPNLLSVNMSAVQFERPDFSEKVAEILSRTRFPSGVLQLELTETAAVKNIESSSARVSALRDLGVKFAIDDFGTGHSSLMFLRRLPIDCLKIDKSFTQDIDTDVSHRVITESVINMANGLGISVVAEGVESISSALTLQKMNCQLLQGYLYSKPISSDEYAELARSELNFAEVTSVYKL